MRTSWPTCCATSPTNLLGSGKTSAQQVVQLVGRWSCQSPTSRHSQCPASWPTSWLSGVYQPTSCTTSSCLVHQTRTCWPTSWQLVGQLVRIVEFGQKNLQKCHKNAESRTITSSSSLTIRQLATRLSTAGYYNLKRPDLSPDFKLLGLRH
jgi:hypothetical protein